MVEFDDTDGAGAIPDEVVTKVGKAIAQIEAIRQDYTERLGAVSAQDAKRALAERAEHEMVKAVTDEGLTVSEYNEVIEAAQSDKDVEERVLAAARAA
jgi:hypothetical protein